MRHYGGMNLEQAAATLGLRPDTLRHQVHKGKLRARKMGRDWYVSDADVRRYRAERLGKRKLNGGAMTEPKLTDEGVATPAVDPDAEPVEDDDDTDEDAGASPESEDEGAAAPA